METCVNTSSSQYDNKCQLCSEKLLDAMLDWLLGTTGLQFTGKLDHKTADMQPAVSGVTDWLDMSCPLSDSIRFCTMHKIAAESTGKQFKGAFRQSSQKHKATRIFRYTAVANRLISHAGWHAMLPITHSASADVWVSNTSCRVALVYCCFGSLQPGPLIELNQQARCRCTRKPAVKYQANRSSCLRDHVT